MGSVHVLFIEDDKMVQQIAGIALSNRGMKVSSALTSAEADTILSREKVDVIICDVLMPHEDGISYLRRLRREGNRLPVILLSALADPVTVKVGIQSGAAAYMIKPFDTQQLYQRILNVIGCHSGV